MSNLLQVTQYLDLMETLISTRIDYYDGLSEQECISEWLDSEYEGINVNSVNDMITYFSTANPNDAPNEHINTFYKLFGHDIGCGSYISFYHILESELNSGNAIEIFKTKYLDEFMATYRTWIYDDKSLNNEELCELAIRNMQIHKINNLYFIVVVIMC